MVTQFGMSEVVGLMAVGEREHEVFLGREFGSRRETSEQTAELVDQEVKRFIDEAYADRAAPSSTSTATCWSRIAAALLERETHRSRRARPARAGHAVAADGSWRPPPPPHVGGAPPVVRERTPAASAPRCLGAPPAEPAGA